MRIRDAAAYLGVSDDTVRRWIDQGVLRATADASGRKVVDGFEVARVARRHAAPPPLPAGIVSSARNRFVGLVTDIRTDAVMAQVELQCGPFRVVSLMSSEAVRDLRLELGSVAAAVVLVIGAAGCGGDDGTEGDDGGGGETTTLTVYAAASLTSSFEQLGEDFEASHDGVEVTFNFAGSSDLVSQIQSGAPADVFASADEANMEKLTTDGLNDSDPELFATNTLEIATPPDNPAGVETLQDLADPDLNLVICAPDVPCGAAAQAVADSADVTLEPVSEEQSVTDVLAKVTSGEADAGLVYLTDVIAAGDDVLGIEFPESESVVNKYPIATIADSEHADLAQEFVDLVLSDDGQQVLADAGFGQP